jgi:hypothetical protein
MRTIHHYTLSWKELLYAQRTNSKSLLLVVMKMNMEAGFTMKGGNEKIKKIEF